MGLSLTKEVLPPRQAPLEPRDLCSLAEKQAEERERRTRAALSRTFWVMVMMLGLSGLLMRFVEMWSW